jgi:hypothetical protein
MIKEEWKQIYNTNYYISNLGNIYNKKRDRLVKVQQRSPNDRGRITIGRGDNRIQSSITSLLKTYWKWEWIKYLKEGEICREVKGHPGYYITSLGRVWSYTSYDFIKPSAPSYKYYWKYSIDGKTYDIHRLVGINFLQGFDTSLCVLHKEENLPPPEIYGLDNLYLGTYKENSIDMVEKGRNYIPTTLPSRDERGLFIGG